LIGEFFVKDKGSGKEELDKTLRGELVYTSRMFDHDFLFFKGRHLTPCDKLGSVLMFVAPDLCRRKRSPKDLSRSLWLTKKAKAS
jgi:hypothetical protein